MGLVGSSLKAKNNRKWSPNPLLELEGDTRCQRPAGSPSSLGHRQIVLWLRNGTSIGPVRSSVVRREKEEVVICEEKVEFWHQVKLCPKEAFDAEQREAVNFLGFL
jgi:hypothetical protein